MDMNKSLLALAFVGIAAFALIYGKVILEAFTAATAAMKGWVSTPKASLTSMTRNKQQDSPLFAKLPQEIRLMIYRYLLVSNGCLTRVGNAVKKKHPDAVKRKRHDEGRPEPYGLDARLLRSCRRVYDEALLVLYRENHFVFTNLSGMGIFQKGGLVTMGAPNKRATTTPMFAFEPAPHGRLTNIRTLSLLFAASVDGDFNWHISPARAPSKAMLQRLMMEPPSALTQYYHDLYRTPHQRKIAERTAREEWRSVLWCKGDGYGGKYATRLKSSIAFPELDYLMLDFGQLGLGVRLRETRDGRMRKVGLEDGVDVAGLIDLIGCERKLSYLAVSGLRHEGTVGALKKGFLKEGGKFVDLDSEDESAEI